MRALLPWLLLGCAVGLCSAAAGAQAIATSVPRVQLVVLVEADGEHPGCTPELPTSDAGPSPWAVLVADVDQAQVRQLQVRICGEDGRWRTLVEGAPHPPATDGSVEPANNGQAQAVQWSIPLPWLGAARSFSLRALATEVATGAVDRLAQADGDWAVLRLALGGDAMPIPALGSGSAFLLLGVLLLVGLRAASPGVAGRTACAGLVLVGGILVATAPTRTQADAVDARVASATDLDDTAAANAPDLLRASVEARMGRLQVVVDVRGLGAPVTPPARVLFLGNSLTYFNDLPRIVQAIAAQAGQTLAIESVVAPSAALEDLYQDSEALTRIAHGDFDVVVMQQGPSSLASSQVELRRWAQAFNGPIRGSGARPALYMVWPEEARFHVFDAVRESYLNAALDVGGDFLPAGESWRAAWRVDLELPLYGDDRFHPSALGSYAAALTIYAGLYGRSPVGLPTTLTLVGGQTLRFDPVQAQIVQAAAWEAWQAFGRRGF